MKIVKKGPKSPKAKTYEFTCGGCKSILKAKSYELREFGFKNDSTEKKYVFMCPVCNCQKVIHRSEMKRVYTIGEVINYLITKIAKGARKEGKEVHGIRMA